MAFGDLLVLLQEHWRFLAELGVDPERLSDFFGDGFLVNVAVIVSYAFILKVFQFSFIHFRFCMVGGVFFWFGVHLIR